MIDFAYKDIKSVKDLFTNYSQARIKMALGWREAREIAKMTLHITYPREADSIAAVWDYFQGNREVEPPVCQCPPASGLRWHEMPVTWAHNSFQQDLPSTARLIRECFAEITAVCGLKVQENNDGNANIVIRHGRLDGRGRTLGITYMPVSGTRMAACGEMCGDIVIDKDEIWSEGYLKTVLMHEILHALGLRHSSNRASIMYFQYQGVRGLGKPDIEELNVKYPMGVPA